MKKIDYYLKNISTSIPKNGAYHLPIHLVNRRFSYVGTKVSHEEIEIIHSIILMQSSGQDATWILPDFSMGPGGLVQHK